FLPITRPSMSSLFPYTTLFRSIGYLSFCSSGALLGSDICCKLGVSAPGSCPESGANRSGRSQMAARALSRGTQQVHDVGAFDVDDRRLTLHDALRDARSGFFRLRQDHP